MKNKYQDNYYGEKTNVTPFNTFATINWDQEDWQKAIRTSLATTALILFESAHPLLAAGIAFTDVMIELWWDTTNPDENWRNILKQTQALIDKNIAIERERTALLALDEIRKALVFYRNRLKEWIDSPSPQTHSQVTNSFTTTLILIDGKMGQFALEPYQILLLPLYAQAANMHLGMLREGLMYEKEWWKNESQVFTYKSDLKEKIKEYSNYCQEWYKKGLATSFSNPATTIEEWAKRNRYRTTMTINVLDISAKFSLFDIDKYPFNRVNEKNLSNKENIPTFQLTRVLATDPTFIDYIPYNVDNKKICEYEASCNPADLDAFLNLPLKFQNYLKNIDFQTVYYSGGFWDEPFAYFISAQNTNIYTNSRSVLSSINQVSPKPDGVNAGSASFIIGEKDYVYGINLFANKLTETDKIHGIEKPYIFQKIEFFNFNSDLNSKQIRPISAGNTTIEFEERKLGFPDNDKNLFGSSQYNYQRANHYLHSTRSCYVRIGSMSPGSLDIYQTYVFHWEHNSVSRNDKVINNRITLFPAVKSDPTLSKGIQILQVPYGYTGGNIVKFITNSELVFRISFENPTTKYKVRLRYVAFNEVAVYFSGVYIQEVFLLIKQISPRKNIEDLKYEDYQYIEFEINMKEGLSIIQEIFKIKSNNEFILDRIEFIPHTLFKN